MIHRRKGRKLKRTASHRKALLMNLSISLIKNKRIRTTEAKAKELRMYVEPLITKAKKAFTLKDSEAEKSIHLRRVARRFLKDRDALQELFVEVAPKIGDRPGGYTRILKTGRRFGDGGKEAIIELVDFSNEIKKKLESNSEKKDEKVASKGKKKSEAESQS